MNKVTTLKKGDGTNFKSSFSKLVSSYIAKLSLACIVLIIILSIASPYFFTLVNFSDILLGTSVIGIVSFGMTLVLISDGIDLSVGSIVALSTVLICVCCNAGLNLFTTLLITAAGATLVGVVNGFFIAALGINPFIITLGTMSVVRGLCFIIIGGRALPFKQETIRYIGSEKFLGVPIPIYFMVVVLIVLVFVLKYTQFGRNVYAIGNNAETARLSGINIIKTSMLVFAINGLLAGIAGFLLAAQTYAGIPSSGDGYELDAITAAILGGTSLKGGEGHLAGTVLGTFIVAIVLNGQNLLGVPYFFQLVSKGVIIIVAMVIARKKD